MFGNLASTSGSYCAFWHVTVCAWLTAIAPIVHSTLIAAARKNLFMVVLLCGVPELELLPCNRVFTYPRRQSGLYLNFCPAMEASYIKPPFATVNTAMPL
jgi:hypothetical protein